MLRLKELQGTFAALYPPGLRLVVLNDGGYSRPRDWAEIRRYRRQLRRYAQLVGLDNSVHFLDQSRFVAQTLGPQGWAERERYRRTFHKLISQLTDGPRSLDTASRADQRLAEALPRALLGSATLQKRAPAQGRGSCARALDTFCRHLTSEALQNDWRCGGGEGWRAVRPRSTTRDYDGWVH